VTTAPNVGLAGTQVDPCPKPEDESGGATRSPPRLDLGHARVIPARIAKIEDIEPQRQKTGADPVRSDVAVIVEVVVPAWTKAR
jgi:hypothetical protein